MSSQCNYSQNSNMYFRKPNVFWGNKSGQVLFSTDISICCFLSLSFFFIFDCITFLMYKTPNIFSYLINDHKWQIAKVLNSASAQSVLYHYSIFQCLNLRFHTIHKLTFLADVQKFLPLIAVEKRKYNINQKNKIQIVMTDLYVLTWY